MPDILLLHGPNLNLLGSREPEIYGSTTLEDINNKAVESAKQAGCSLNFFQSNAEHELVEQIHAAKQAGVKAIVINPAAFTHTSVALRDALAGVGIPFIEIHLSNVHAREEFRQHSFLSDLAVGVICGLGADGYGYAIQTAAQLIKK